MGSRVSGFIGSLVMLSFGAISFYRFYTTGIIFFLLMVFRDVLASLFLLTRNEKIQDSDSMKFAFISYFSSAVPIFYLKGNTNSEMINSISTIISIVGFLLSTLALIELGKSFGVSPANRGRISTGVYKFTNHPMYLGYAISELGLILINPINLMVYFLSISFYCYRSKKEYLILEN